MSNKTNKRLVPELRFPEFRSIPSWQVTKLEDVFDFLSTTNNSRADLSPNGDTFYVHYGDLHTKHHVYLDFSKVSIPRISNDLCRNAATLKNGDLILADASEDIDGVAKAVEVKGLPAGVKAVSGLHTILLRDRCDFFSPGFKGLLREIGIVKKQVARLAVGVKVYAISKSALRGVLIPFTKKEEQQKIADCLSSIDELIATQTQKIEALKTLKKGLMQQLFPAEGETVPHLRFPEFRDSGDWCKKQLHEVAFFVNEKVALENLSPERYLSTVNLLQDFMGMVPSPTRPSAGSATKFKIDDVLISNIRPYLKKIWMAEIEGGASNDVIVIRAKKEVTTKYLLYLLKSDLFIKYVMTSAKGVKMPRGDVELIKKFIVATPTKPDEQKKIADCLSSIDELIVAHSQKLEALKTLKKGLMQGLFPSTSEVEE